MNASRIDLETSNITVYSKTVCQQCQMVYRFLNKNDAPYEVINVEQDAAALELIKSLGYMQAPVVLVTNKQTGEHLQHFSGFQPDALKTMLGIAL